GAAGIADPRKLGRIGVKTIGLYMLTTAVAITIGLLLANIIAPGEGVTIGEAAEKPDIQEAPPIKETLLNIVPENPIQAMAEAEMLQIIFFALFFGIAMALLGDKVDRVKAVIDQGSEVTIKMVDLAMRTAPYAAFALMARAIGQAGVELIGSRARYTVTIPGSPLPHMAVIYGLLIWLLGKMNPLHFYKAMAPAMEVAFTTSSSAATLAVTMECAERDLKVPKSISSFVLPLGATVNMEGPSIWHGLAALCFALLVGLDLHQSKRVR